MPRTNNEADRLSEEILAGRDIAAWCELFHMHESTYIDPVFGEYRGRSAIQHWLVEVMGRAGRWDSRGVGPRFFDGFVAAGEAELVIPLGPSEFVLPFAWIQRYRDGSIVYRRDYYDTHELRKTVAAVALKSPESPA